MQLSAAVIVPDAVLGPKSLALAGNQFGLILRRRQRPGNVPFRPLLFSNQRDSEEQLGAGAVRVEVLWSPAVGPALLDQPFALVEREVDDVVRGDAVVGAEDDRVDDANAFIAGVR